MACGPIIGIGVNILPAGGYVASLNPGGSKFLSLLYNIYFFLFRFFVLFSFISHFSLSLVSLIVTADRLISFMRFLR